MMFNFIVPHIYIGDDSIPRFFFQYTLWDYLCRLIPKLHEYVYKAPLLVL